MHPDLRGAVANPATVTAFVGERCVIAARFGSKEQNRILAIRDAIITDVDVSTGIYSFRFRLGNTRDFDNSPDLLQRAILLEGNAATAVSSYLAFRSASIALGPQPSTLPDGLAWYRFATLVASESGLPIHDSAKRGLFFFFDRPVGPRGKVAVESVFKSITHGVIYGAKFKEGQKYELKFSYYVPFLTSKNTTVQVFEVNFQLPSSNIEFNVNREQLIGNYGVSALSLTAAIPSGTYERLTAAFDEKEYTAQDPQYKITTTAISLPLSVRFSLLYRLRSRWARNLVLWLAMTCLGIASSIGAIAPKLIDGTLESSKVISKWPLLLVIAIISALASLAITSLQPTKSK